MQASGGSSKPHFGDVINDYPPDRPRLLRVATSSHAWGTRHRGSHYGEQSSLSLNRQLNMAKLRKQQRPALRMWDFAHH